MCGICGFIGFKEPGLIEKMISATHHRGPDDQGYYEDDRVTLGHNRLSIIDLSSQGHQPIGNEDGSIQVVFNGEIYNFRSLRKKLEGKGYVFKSRTDSEVLVHGYHAFGENVVYEIEGMYAFAIWDVKKQKLVLARDPLGIKPLYYFYDAHQLIFSSEIKAILCSSHVQKKIQVHMPNVFFYLTHQYSPPQETLFSLICKLEPGHLLTFQQGHCTRKAFWKLEDASPPDVKNIPETLFQLLENAVGKMLTSDVPLGVLLSGGLDSSIVTALMRPKIRDLHTFTAGFHAENDELHFSKLVSSHMGTTHHEFYVDASQVGSLIPKMVWHMDEPLADGGAIATYLIGEHLKQFATVILVGEGADELFGGYRWHRFSKWRLPHWLWCRANFYFTTYVSASRPWFQEQYERYCAQFESKDSRSLFQKISHYELTQVLPNHLLMKVDKMTMAHGVEARVPFLDRDLVSFVYRLPDHFKVKGWQGKAILRDLFKSKLPKTIVQRKKQGFLLPIRQWIEVDLKEMIWDHLNSENAMSLNFLSRSEIQALGRARSGLKEIERTALLWRLFILELWHDLFFKKSQKS
ncbi:MAG: asparagine synthase (glutamine-hydrolyzing) [Deltaproteobacteria bacterium]|nr:asparagine synthase (glutamine-hydrolyzing) [Deltaproteobacteria bacterium]